MPLSKKQKITAFILIFLVYLSLVVLISGFYRNVPLIIIYASTVSWFKLGFSIALSLAIAVFVSLNSIRVYEKYKERKKCLRETLTGGIGAVGGLAVGVCPLCITGVLPLILSAVGISFSFASLPFQGIEIQILVLAILIFSYKNLK